MPPWRAVEGDGLSDVALVIGALWINSLDVDGRRWWKLELRMKMSGGARATVSSRVVDACPATRVKCRLPNRHYFTYLTYSGSTNNTTAHTLELHQIV